MLTGVDHHRAEALVAIEPRSRDGLGVVRYASIPGNEMAAEVGIAVADAWQGRGVGRVLLTALIERAEREGFARLHATVLGDNRPALALVRRMGFVSLGPASVMVELSRPLRPCPPARTASLARE